MSNVVLIGMPGAGKSTVGILLAKALNLGFLDTDLVIQRKYEKKLYEIINESGIDEFIKIEDKVLSEIVCEHSVIATGGSAIFGENAMRNLKANGKVVYLKLSSKAICDRISNIKTRGIAMKNGETIEDIYNVRKPLYEKYADITIDCESQTIEETVSAVIDLLNTP